MEEGDGVRDLDGVGVGEEAAEEDGVDGGGPVLEGVEDELNVGVLGDLVTNLAAHDLRLFRCLYSYHSAATLLLLTTTKKTKTTATKKRKREGATIVWAVSFLSVWTQHPDDVVSLPQIC